MGIATSPPSGTVCRAVGRRSADMGSPSGRSGTCTRVGSVTASLPELRADCARCAGLCCVAPAFAASADFAIEKRAGQPCPNLQNDLRCRFHSRLRERGFPGCVAYDCFGAGQRIVQETFGGADWRGSPQLARRMFDAFAVLRALHELLVYLD